MAISYGVFVLINQLYNDRRRQGVCVGCGCEVKGFIRCGNCRMKRSKGETLRRQRYQRLGLCVSCKNENLNGLVQCDECLENLRIKRKGQET